MSLGYEMVREHMALAEERRSLEIQIGALEKEDSCEKGIKEHQCCHGREADKPVLKLWANFEKAFKEAEA